SPDDHKRGLLRRRAGAEEAARGRAARDGILPGRGGCEEVTSMSVCPPLGELRRVICESLGHDTLAAIDEHVRDCPDCNDNLAQLEQDLRWAHSRPADPLPEEGSFPRIEGFEIERELGRGGMGVIYLARKETLPSRPVALKVVPRAPGLSDAAQRCRRDEA